MSTDHKFKVGDRVAVYGLAVVPLGRSREKGEVTGALYSTIKVKLDATGKEYSVHPKQCRKLVKKERRRVWISEADITGTIQRKGDNATWVYAETDARQLKCESGDELVEFVEVPRKKS